MNNEIVSKPNPTLLTINEIISTQCVRLEDICRHLKCACNGENEKILDSCEQKEPYPTPSLLSIDMRLSDNTRTINQIEDYVKRLHS